MSSEICRFSRGKGHIICGHYHDCGYLPTISPGLKIIETSLKPGGTSIDDLCRPALEANSEDLMVIGKRQSESSCSGYAKN